MTAVDKFFEFTKSTERLDEAAIAAVFDQLEAVPAEAMIGNWGGAGFDTGHPALAQMNAVKWAGKNFHTVEDVDPFIFIDDDGKRVANHDFGKARLREMTFRGVATAAMIYDIIPVIDHFRRVSDDAVLGAMDNRDLNVHGTFYFYLTRVRD